jgi:predicted O-linked N-acetylglucosamine transferase (SPINDLY family)
VAPGYADAWSNRASALREVGREREALASIERALRITPKAAEAWCMHGQILFDLGRSNQALESFSQALMLRPQLRTALFMKAQICIQKRRHGEALALFDRLLELDPSNVPAHWLRALAALPTTALTEAAGMQASEAFSRRVDALRALGLEEAHQGVGALTLFGFTYQEQNNRALFAKYGALCADATAHWQACQPPAARPKAEAASRVRLCIVSGHLREHSVWHANTRGLVEHLDRTRFELQLVHLDDATPDAETAWAKAHCDRFDEGRRSFAAWRDTIAAGAPDVILYPEIGMDPTAFKLASLRLAPAQVATWGHPHTTGLPTVDVFVSADAFEPADAEEHYTERLVRLPRLGCCFAPHIVADVETDLARLGIEADRPILLSPGTPYKYAPQHDQVLAEIAKRLGRCRIVFFANNDLKDLGDRLWGRLAQAFAAKGLDFADHCAVTSWQNRSAYYGLMRRAHLMLDTIGFSGFNTAMGALECGLPIVAYEGRFMRGRFASGLLRGIGLAELVASDAQSYVDLAVSLAKDAGRRGRAHQHIEAARARLFDDREAVHAFQNCLLDLRNGKLP